MSDRESLRSAERIMASVQDAKRKEQASQAMEQVNRPKQGELFPDAVRAAKHRLRQGS